MRVKWCEYDLDIRFEAPSYKRAGKVITHKTYPMVRYWVDEEEADGYEKALKGKAEVVRVKRGIQGNVSRIKNYILDKSFEDGADVVFLMDDDMRGIYRWVRCERRLITAEELGVFVAKYSVVAKDIGARLWGFNINTDKRLYRELVPFSTVAAVLAACVHLRESEIRYDERLPLKEDYDLYLQHLNKYRVVLRLDFAYYDMKQSEQEGGCAMYRNLEREKKQFMLLRKKWGSRIVRLDDASTQMPRKNKKRERLVVDYNPRISVPIKGV